MTALTAQAKSYTSKLSAYGTVQSALGLRSTWFDVGILSLTPPSPSLPVVYGSSVQLTGVIRGLSGVSFEQRPLAALSGNPAFLEVARKKLAGSDSEEALPAQKALGPDRVSGLA